MDFLCSTILSVNQTSTRYLVLVEFKQSRVGRKSYLFCECLTTSLFNTLHQRLQQYIVGRGFIANSFTSIANQICWTSNHKVVGSEPTNVVIFDCHYHIVSSYTHGLVVVLSPSLRFYMNLQTETSYIHYSIQAILRVKNVLNISKNAFFLYKY